MHMADALVAPAVAATMYVCSGGAVSLAASSNLDGLEWSMERLTGSTELENDGTGAHAAAE